MPDTRFNGDLDAPHAPAALCTEPDCAQPADGANHRRHGGHFFNPGEPLLSRPSIDKNARRTTRTPQPATQQKSLQKESSKASPLPPRCEGIEGKITDEVVNALRGQRIASHLRIRSINITPEYSIASDSRLLAADVRVHLRLLFPCGDSDE